MFWRFCLYGFLKNQRYFEPFLILAFLEWGLSFFAIGVLIAIREATTNALEIASGALADTWGRRRAMMLSFGSYLVALALFATSRHVVTLGAAMALYGVGEAFRSGTHKAMILTWLRGQGRADERTEVYGTTRSWSKKGSAVGVIIGSIWVLATGDVDALFWMTMVPYVLDFLNLATYPASLDGEEHSGELGVRSVLRQMWASATTIWGSGHLRRLLAESSGFLGGFKTTKDYLQPVLQAAAAAGLAGWIGSAEPGSLRETAILVGPVYAVLYIISAVMSKRTGAYVARIGSEEGAAAWLWGAFLAVFVVLCGAAWWESFAVMVAAFMTLYVLEALWRPVIVTRFDTAGPEQQGATLLSVESQARSITTMVLAPLLGWAVDWTTRTSSAPDWFPVALLAAPDEA